MKDVTVLADEIINLQAQAKVHKDHINSLFNKIMLGLSENKNKISKEIENMYKEIDSTFTKKSKVEQRILELKREIFKELQVD